MPSYKEEKEAFVSDTSGSSVFHILKISSITIGSLACYFALSTRCPRMLLGRRKLLTRVVAELTLLVLPTLLGLTIGTDKPLHISGGLCFLYALLVARPASTTTYPPPQATRSSPPSPVTKRPLPPVHSLTIYRAQMLLLTFICILAVDFPVFPRYLAKCESWGASVMDLGVGSFVFSQGIASAIPIVRDPHHLSSGRILPKLSSTVRKVLPVLILGLVRVLLVKGTEYPEHVSEYGVHWNFFITLALLPVVSVLIQPLIVAVPASAIGLCVTIAHQLLLLYTPLQSWAISDERLGVIGQNKEGVTSFPGYLAIHVMGFATGLVILPTSPSHFRRALHHATTSPSPTAPKMTSRGWPDVRQLDKVATELGGYVIVWWALFGLARWMGGGTSGISRRLANMPYVLFTAAYNSLFILAYMTLEIAFSPPSPRTHGKRDSTDSIDSSHGTSSSIDHVLSAKLHDRKPSASLVAIDAGIPQSTVSEEEEAHFGGGRHVLEREPLARPLQVPLLLEAINLNGMVLFLVANVLTGLVNLSMRTMYASDGAAMLTLAFYLGVLCGVAWCFRGVRLVRL